MDGIVNRLRQFNSLNNRFEVCEKFKSQNSYLDQCLLTRYVIVIFYIKIVTEDSFLIYDIKFYIEECLA